MKKATFMFFTVFFALCSVHGAQVLNKGDGISAALYDGIGGYVYNAAYDKDGFDENGYDRAGYNANGYDKDGYDRNGFDVDGYDREGYHRDGFNKEGYNRAGYDRDGSNREGYTSNGYGRDGYNKQGQTREEVERAAAAAAKREAQNKQTNDVWGGSYAGIFLGGGAQFPLGGFGEIGVEIGITKSIFLDASYEGTGLKVTDEMVENKLGQSKVDEIKQLTGNSALDWKRENSFIVRIGASVPLIFTTRLRFSAGGGLIIQKTGIKVKQSKTNEDGIKSSDDKNYDLMSFIAPYAGGRFDILFSSKNTWRFFGFIGYHADFLPASEMKTYYGSSVPVHHAVFAGFSGGRYILW